MSRTHLVVKVSYPFEQKQADPTTTYSETAEVETQDTYVPLVLFAAIRCAPLERIIHGCRYKPV